MLTHMRGRLIRCDTFGRVISTVLDDAIALLGAEYGNLQVLVGEQLLIVAQRGLPQDFLDCFRRVDKDDGSACGRALLSGKPVIISDVEKDAEFASYRNIAKRTHFRAVQSTPLIAPSGQRLGIVSTHFANPHCPSRIEMETLAAYGVYAAQHALELLGDTSLDDVATQMNGLLYNTVAVSAASKRSATALHPQLR